MKTLAPLFYMALMGLLVQCSKTEVPQNVPCPEPTAAEQELIKNNPGFEYCFSKAQCSPNMAEVQERLFGKWEAIQIWDSSTELHWEWRDLAVRDTIEYTRDLKVIASIRSSCQTFTFQFTSRRMCLSLFSTQDCRERFEENYIFTHYRFEGEYLILNTCVLDCFFPDCRSTKYRKIKP